MDKQCSSCGGFCKKSGCERQNVQPKRTWAGLTDEEIESINVRLAGSRDLARLFARAIEAKLKQKNSYTEEKNT